MNDYAWVEIDGHGIIFRGKDHPFIVARTGGVAVSTQHENGSISHILYPWHRVYEAGTGQR